MKTIVECMQWRCASRALAMMLMLVSPFVAFAQADDIYFVPTKSSEKTTIVVESVADKYNIVNETKVTVRNADEYNRRYAYTDDPEAYIEENYGDEYVVADEYQDYDYSTRIIRFRSPGRAISNIYWDLAYTSYANDWYIYDNGYSIDIYPTINNPLYYFTDFAWNSLNWYNWRYWYNRYNWNYSYLDWYYPRHYCSYSPYWYHHNHHHHSHWYTSHWNNHIHASRWHSGRNLRNTMYRDGGITARRYDTRGAVKPGNDRRGKNGNGGVDLRGGNGKNDRNVGRTVAGTRNDKNGNAGNGKVDLRGKDSRNANVRNDNDRNGKGREIKIGGNTGARRQQPARTGVNGNRKNEDTRKNGSVGNGNGARRQQPARTTVNSNGNRKNGNVGSNAGARRQQPARVNINGNGNKRNEAAGGAGNNVRQRGNGGNASAQGQSSVNRRGSSTGNYNRQSSTNTVRSRGTSTQTRSSSGSSASGSRSRGGGSSYSSSSSSSRGGGSSYSSGSSSRSSGGGGSSFGGGGSRSSGGGGSRGGGRGR